MSDKVKSIYNNYLIERIFNFRMFYSVIKAVIFADNKTGYRVGQSDIIKALSLGASLPNVFSRQAILLYAILHIHENTSSEYSFWKTEHLTMDKSNLIDDELTKHEDFYLSEWKKQFILFSKYLSNFIIPIYEWCFVGAFFESMENKFPNRTHNEILYQVKEILESFMESHENLMLSPFILVNKNDCRAYAA